MKKNIVVKVQSQSDVKFPEYKTAGSAGADVYAYLSEDISLAPGEFKLIPTGLFLEIPQGYEIQVRPRSGLAAKYGITVLNSPGTIDSDYRGEAKVCLINLGKKMVTISNGDRIAQFVLAPVCCASYQFSQTLSETKRGSGGYGSTGK
ncbi:MAG: deoxyuridine 5'-triphosphate nucleotidohydrolase [Treponema sp. CETP13]|nr:MAG: deoxyuridine 5'-triphosphate nucleotidohydrolase [Treponema sp. CETP13]